MMRAALGAALAAAIATAALRTRALTLGGAAAAFVVGTTVFAVGGWPGATVLLSFFVPSTLLSRLSAGSRPRSAWQVLANGGVPAACAALAPRLGAAWGAGFAGAVAAASADTWGTEVGMRFGGRARSILSLRPVEAGRSGGVTLWGSAATVAGALCVAQASQRAGVAPWRAVAAGGVVGALCDSILGASIQELRWCASCARECEAQLHDCGAHTALRRGLPGFNNDAVNFAATLCGAAVASLIVS